MFHEGMHEAYYVHSCGITGAVSCSGKTFLYYVTSRAMASIITSFAHCLEVV